MRVRAVITTPVSMTSVYVGNYFEITGSITRAYYIIPEGGYPATCG